MQLKKNLDDEANISQLETIISGLSEGVIIVGFEGTIRYANAAALAMHGAEHLEELGATTEAYKAIFHL